MFTSAKHNAMTPRLIPLFIYTALAKSKKSPQDALREYVAQIEAEPDEENAQTANDAAQTPAGERTEPAPAAESTAASSAVPVAVPDAPLAVPDEAEDRQAEAAPVEVSDVWAEVESATSKTAIKTADDKTGDVEPD